MSLKIVIRRGEGIGIARRLMVLLLLQSALLLCCGLRMAQAQERLLWGDLPPGRYAVGFQSQIQFDLTRLYDPEYPSPARQASAKPARPIFLAIWYPAKPTDRPPMVYRDYLPQVSKDPRFHTFSERLARYTEEVVRSEVISENPPQEWDAEEREALATFLSTPTHAVRNAAPPRGRFPLILYHPGLGGSYEDNSVLFEYLASHGYVVMSSAYEAEDSSRLDVNWDLTRSFKDLTFLLRYARTLPFVDAERLGVLGHSYGAQAVLAWRSEANSPIDAVVSLDSTVENVGIDFPGFAKLKAQLEGRSRAYSVPVLRFASVENKPKFETLERYLKYAPRYEAAVASLEHNDYLTHGAVHGALLPNKEKDASIGRLRRESYERVCRHVLAFFDLTLKRDADADALLKRSLDGAGQDASFALRYRAPAPLPPTGRQLLGLIAQQGMQAAETLLRQCRADIEEFDLSMAATGLQEAGKKEEA